MPKNVPLWKYKWSQSELGIIAGGLGRNYFITIRSVCEKFKNLCIYRTASNYIESKS